MTSEITLYDSRTRQKQPLRPDAAGRVGMYVCGPTVYDRAHIGNARPAVVFDVLFRLLRHELGAGRVTYVRNFTDVDDKINARAAESRGPGESLEAAVRRITDETIGWYHEDMGALGTMRPDHEPRCTEYIPQMIAMAERLIAAGHAYAAEGHVLFEVASYAGYGGLSRRSLDEMEAGARVEVAPYKRNPMDFVLWKPSTPEQPGWDSPWGRGRPGWHIECSAMAKALLGDRFQIHAGGIDLQFPHHENERAQSCCANATEEMADIWMHNGYLMVEGEKMSKSLGNFFTVKDLRDRGIPGEVMRMVLLSTQYRQPLDWTGKRVAEAEAALRRWRGLCAGVAPAAAVPAAVRAALADDINTPKAIAALHALAGQGDAAGLRAGAELLGLLTDALGGWEAAAEADADVAAGIDRLLAARAAARKARDFARADAIRDGLAAAGVEVKDTPQGAEWQLGPDFDAARLAGLEAAG
ncbi:cysteine--tRNA ligase [Paralimibaculum aggregatum]|uniref:Cysteine--tRNA ligase n=1 Tax=Paralimibaculum aggregatum TaxID=3036245 RepID=A0ABQ6LF71_9RHOB|nr:cysteine--tRNA ligase [Limibaculum sp. NKW23]GMG81642.1 cysteine--tRNA ligase [Limibaculum sp. NKW23]